MPFMCCKHTFLFMSCKHTGLFMCCKHPVLFMCCKHTVTVILNMLWSNSLLVCSTVGDTSHAKADEDLRNIPPLCAAMLGQTGLRIGYQSCSARKPISSSGQRERAALKQCAKDYFEKADLSQLVADGPRDAVRRCAQLRLACSSAAFATLIGLAFVCYCSPTSASDGA